MRTLSLLAAALVAAPALAEGCKLGKMAELPVTMRGMQPTVTLKINGQPVSFLADSGAFMSLITAASARQLDLKETAAPPGLFLTGVGGSANVGVTKVRDVTLAGQELHDIYFLVGGSEVGGDNIGLVGQNVLGLGDAEYDLSGGAIRLFRVSGCGKQSLAYWAEGKPVQVLQIEDTSAVDKHVYAPVVVNGVKLRAMFDTGATTSMLTKSGAARAGIHTDDPGVRSYGLSSGLGKQQVQSWIAPIKSFKVGAEEIANTRIRIADTPGSDFDMLVGADFFLAHRVFVSNAQRQLYITYNGAAVFRLGAPQAAGSAPGTGDDGPEPADADAYARRGAARSSRRAYDLAIADFDKAVELAPKEPRYLVQRAEVRLFARQPLRAKTDLDAALTLDPGNVDALVTRARMYLIDRDRAAARTDLVAAAKVAAPQADIRITIGALFSAAQSPEDAAAQYTLWLDAHRVDSKRPDAQNGRCWARALVGKDLAGALDDCNQALRARLRDPNFLDSRGLVRLRQGDNAGAIADYDMALAAQPRRAWSLYGRGLAKLRLGKADEGKKDIAAALAIAPMLAADVRRFGVIPATGDPR